MPQLDPTWYPSQLFWLAITFGLLYVLLARIVLPPILRVMEDRGNRVTGDLARAQQLKDEAEQAKADYERVMADARARSQQAFNEVMVLVKKQSEAAGAEMDRTLAARTEEAEARIQAKKQALMNGLSADSGALVADIVEKMTRSRPDANAVETALGQARASA